MIKLDKINLYFKQSQKSKTKRFLNKIKWSKKKKKSRKQWTTAKIFCTNFQITTSWRRTKMMIMKTITISIKHKSKLEWQVKFKIFCSPQNSLKCISNNNRMSILLKLILIILKFLRITTRCTTSRLKNMIEMKCRYQIFWLKNLFKEKFCKITPFQIFNFQIKRNFLQMKLILKR